MLPRTGTKGKPSTGWCIREKTTVTCDPLSEVIDEPLDINPSVVTELRIFRSREKFLHLPGVDVAKERERLSKVLDDLSDTLLQGVEANPTKLWVLTQFQKYLVAVQDEDTEGRDHFGREVEQIMDILGIESSDGLLSAYLGGI